MNNIIGHLVGIDAIHKHQLIRYFKDKINIIDLDNIQQTIYNDNDILKLKLHEKKINEDIKFLKKQKKLLAQNKSKLANFKEKYKNFLKLRALNKNKLNNLWKEKMCSQIDMRLATKSKNILFIGFNIYPYDYRQKINLPIPLGPDNKLIYNITAHNYAANQIKYYLHKYQDKIVNGTFNLKLLNQDYLISKYDKFINYYDQQKYILLTHNKIIDKIIELNKQVIPKKKKIYVPLLYQVSKFISASPKIPITGYPTRDLAIVAIKAKIKKNKPIYIYKVKPDKFKLVDNSPGGDNQDALASKVTYVAYEAVEILDAENILLTL